MNKQGVYLFHHSLCTVVAELSRGAVAQRRTHLKTLQEARTLESEKDCEVVVCCTTLT